MKLLQILVVVDEFSWDPSVVGSRMLEVLDAVEDFLTLGFPLKYFLDVVSVPLVVFLQVSQISSWPVELEVFSVNPDWVVTLLENDGILDDVSQAILLVLDGFDDDPAPDG